MAILVDYRCRSCAARFEQWVSAPAPHRLACPACGADASRAWSPVALGGRARAVSGPGTGTAISGPAATPLCVTNPDVPGLCHMSPSAARTWLARARKDSRSLEREIARQEQAAKAVPPRLEDIVSHTHSHGSGLNATGVHSTPDHTHVARSTRPPSR